MPLFERSCLLLVASCNYGCARHVGSVSFVVLQQQGGVVDVRGLLFSALVCFALYAHDPDALHSLRDFRAKA